MVKSVYDTLHMKSNLTIHNVHGNPQLFVVFVYIHGNHRMHPSLLNFNVHFQS